MRWAGTRTCGLNRAALHYKEEQIALTAQLNIAQEAITTMEARVHAQEDFVSSRECTIATDYVPLELFKKEQEELANLAQKVEVSIAREARTRSG
jgi:hypothetical protein